MKRKPLHYGVHLGIGLFILIVSFITMSSSDNPAIMQIFAVVGGIFVLIGIIRFFIQKEPKIKPKRDEENFARRVSGVSAIDRREEEILRNLEKDRNNPKNIPTIIYCNKCRAKNYNTSRFCHLCGERLR